MLNYANYQKSNVNASPETNSPAPESAAESDYQREQRGLTEGVDASLERCGRDLRRVPGASEEVWTMRSGGGTIVMRKEECTIITETGDRLFLAKWGPSNDMADGIDERYACRGAVLLKSGIDGNGSRVAIADLATNRSDEQRMLAQQLPDLVARGHLPSAAEMPAVSHE